MLDRDDLRLQLRLDSLIIPLEDGGVSLRNARGWFAMKSRMAYQWMERLAAQLDGVAPLGQLRRAWSPAEAPGLEKMLRALWQNGFLKVVAGTPLRQQLKESEPRFAQQLAFVDQYVDDASAAFEQFRKLRVLCIGAPQALTTVVATLVESGTRALDVLPTRASNLDLATAPNAQIRQLPAASWAPEDEEALAGLLHDELGAIVFVAEPTEVAAVVALQRAALRRGTLFLPLVTYGALSWAGPVAFAGGDACWECSWRRIVDGSEPRLQSPPLDSPVALSLAAHHLTFDLFCHATGARVPELRGHARVVDRQTLASKLHRIEPHPLCPCRNHGQQTSAAPDGTPAPEPFLALIDDVFGILRQVDGGELSQLPVPRAAAGAAPASGLSHREARAEAAIAALARYCERTYAAISPWSRSDRAALGVGRDRDEAAVRALFALAPLEPGEPWTSAALDLLTQADSSLAHLRSLLAIDKRALEVEVATSSWGMALARVRSGDHELGRGLHVGTTAATRAALLNALVRGGAIPAAETRTIVAPPDGWAACREELFARLRAQGLAVEAAAVEVDPALSRAGYVTVTVGIAAV